MMEPAASDAHELWYLTWRDAAGCNVTEAARRLDIPRTSVQSAHDRNRWADRLTRERNDAREHVTAEVWARLAAELPAALDTLIAAAIRTDDSRKPPPGSPTLTAVKAALAHLAMFGITPVRTINATISTAPATSRYTNEQLDAMTLDQLITVASGKPVALPNPGVPQDFMTTQPGGREVTDPPPPVNQPGAESLSQVQHRSVIFPSQV